VDQRYPVAATENCLFGLCKLVSGRQQLQLDHVPVSLLSALSSFSRRFLSLMRSFADYLDCRRSQTDFTFRCLFPKYSDWDIAYTPSGLFKQKVNRLIRYTIGFGLMVGLVLGYLSGYRLQEMARSSVAMCLGALKDQASWLQSRVQT
jgi:hypothetical protein